MCYLPVLKCSEGGIDRPETAKHRLNVIEILFAGTLTCVECNSLPVLLWTSLGDVIALV